MPAANLLQAGGEFLPMGRTPPSPCTASRDRGAGVLCGKALEGLAFAGLRVEEAAAAADSRGGTHPAVAASVPSVRP